MTGSKKIFEVGCLHLIRGKITTLRVDHDTPERQRGLLEATPSRNGNRLDQAHFYGFMGNVSLQPLDLAATDSFPLPPMIAGAGKSILWYVDPSIYHLET